MGFKGIELEVPLGDYGIISDVPQPRIPPGALITGRNVCFYNGTLQKAPGTLKYNATPLDAGIVAVHDWWPTINLQRLIAVTSAGSVYRDVGGRVFSSANGTATTTAITTGLGVLTPNCMFIEGGQESGTRERKLFLLTNGVSQVKVLGGDGTAFTSISSPATDWTTGQYPKVGVMHRARFWVFKGQNYYASDTADHGNFLTNTLTGAVFPGEGGEIRGAYVFKGRHFVFKEGGFVYWLNDEDTSSANWYWQKLSSNFGLSAPNAIIEMINDMVSGNVSGSLTSLTASFNLGNVEAADIFKNAQLSEYMRSNLSDVGLIEQHGIYYAKKKCAFFTYRSSYQTSNDTLLTLDANRPNMLRIVPWIKGTPQCLGLRMDVNKIHRPMYGDASGYVHLMDYEDRLEGATAYTGDAQTSHMDFGWADPKLAVRRKAFSFLRVTYVPEGAWNLSCDYFIDGRFIETLSFPMTQLTDSRLNTLLLSTNRLAQANTETFTHPLAGTGRTISFRFYQAGSNQSFQLTSIKVGFMPGGESAQKDS